MAVHEPFESFWPERTFNEICNQTNLYAKQATRKKMKGGSNGGKNWVNICSDELKGYLQILLYMGLKKLLQIRSYWEKLALFGCRVIKSIFTRDRFEAILRCIHLVDNDQLVRKGSLGYDKLGKV